LIQQLRSKDKYFLHGFPETPVSNKHNNTDLLIPHYVATTFTTLLPDGSIQVEALSQIGAHCCHWTLFLLVPAFFWFFALELAILPLIGTSMDLWPQMGVSFILGFLTGCYAKRRMSRQTAIIKR
jgi:fucose 4-O-acetylase-like acetyltransferase